MRLQVKCHSTCWANIHSFHPHNDLVTLVLLLLCLEDETTGVGHSNWDHRWQNQSSSILWGTEGSKSQLPCWGKGRRLAQELQSGGRVTGEARWVLSEGQSAVRMHSASHSKVMGKRWSPMSRPRWRSWHLSTSSWESLLLLHHWIIYFMEPTSSSFSVNSFILAKHPLQ